MKTTVINHSIRTKLSLTSDEYCLMDLIHQQNIKKTPVSPKLVHDNIGYGKIEAIEIIEGLKKKLFIVRDQAGSMMVTDNWLNHFKAQHTFEQFWDLYHKITGKTKTDRSPSEKYWNKLTALEKSKACNEPNLRAYSATQDDKQYLKKARTYLANKSFNDEYGVYNAPGKRSEVSYNDLMKN